jgi:hypothetical protein
MLLSAPDSNRPLRILLLSLVRAGFAATCHDREYALAEFSRHDVFVFSPLEERDWFPPLVNFDVVILHYSIMIWSENYLPQRIEGRAYLG